MIETDQETSEHFTDVEEMRILLNTEETITGKIDQPISPEPFIQIELRLPFDITFDLWVSKSDMEKLRGEGIFPIWMEPRDDNLKERFNEQ